MSVRISPLSVNLDSHYNALRMNAGAQSSQPIDIAVGVIRDAVGRVLINQRQPSKPFAGRWEFPGGKVDPGETTAQALNRELDEELGITVRQQRPLITFPYRYDTFTVRLCVNEVLEYQGVPTGREGQALDWVNPDKLHGVDLLGANSAIVRAIILPRICLISDTARFGVQQTLELLEKHVEVQRVLLIIREKAMPQKRLRTFAENVREICRPRGSLVCVHADCALDDDVNIDGIHFAARALEQDTQLQNSGLIGVSCHTGEEDQAAVDRGAGYALLSPVKPTASHPEAMPLGWPRFTQLCAEIPMPVYALGGMSFEDFDDAIAHGAQGPAILSAAWQ